jgi:hypothetical protein
MSIFIIKFTRYSILQAVIVISDYTIFWILLFATNITISYAFIISRIVLTFPTYIFHKQIVFQSANGRFYQYFVLILVNLLLGGEMVNLMKDYIWNDILTKLSVDTFLFIVNFLALKIIFDKDGIT